MTNSDKNCQHKNTIDVSLDKHVGNHVFIYNTLECVDCGSVLWSQKTEDNFRKWLNNLDNINIVIRGKSVDVKPEVFLKIRAESTIFDISTEEAAEAIGLEL